MSDVGFSELHEVVVEREIRPCVSGTEIFSSGIAFGQTQGIESFEHPWHSGLRSLHFFRRDLPTRQGEKLNNVVVGIMHLQVRHPVFVLNRARDLVIGPGL